MIILYYDRNDGSGWTPEHLYRFKEAISKSVDDKILLIPKDIDVVLDAPVEQLVALRDYIDKAIKEKESK
jgi:hypothetical protein